MTKGINVPKEHRHLMRRERQDTEDYKPMIRSLILRKGSKEYISGEQFAEAMGTSSTATHIKKLMSQGFVTRKPIKGHHGRRYAYMWHDEPLSHENAILASGGVVTRMLDLPELPIDELTLTKMRGLIFDWVSEKDDPETRGAVRFHNWLTNKLKEVKEKREEILRGDKK